MVKSFIYKANYHLFTKQMFTYLQVSIVFTEYEVFIQKPKDSKKIRFGRTLRYT